MEALAILLVFFVAAVIFVVTWFGVAQDAGRNPLLGRAQLEAHRAALQQKALRARSEGWDDSMRDQIAFQLDEVDRRLAKLGQQT